MKELVGIILLTVLVVFGSRNSNTDVSLVGTSPKLFDVCQVSTGNPDYRNKGSPTLIHSKVDVKIIGYGYNNKSILMK